MEPRGELQGRGLEAADLADLRLPRSLLPGPSVEPVQAWRALVLSYEVQRTLRAIRFRRLLCASALRTLVGLHMASINYCPNTESTYYSSINGRPESIGLDRMTIFPPDRADLHGRDVRGRVLLPRCPAGVPALRGPGRGPLHRHGPGAALAHDPGIAWEGTLNFFLITPQSYKNKNLSNTSKTYLNIQKNTIGGV